MKTFHLTLTLRLYRIVCFIVLLSVTGRAVAQINIPSEKIVQSPFYDAIGLYYAMRHIPAFPIGLNDVDNLKAKKLYAGKDTSRNFYNIFETATGKIILDDVPEDKLKTMLDSISKANNGAYKQVLISILARNAELPSTANWKSIQSIYKENNYLNIFTDSDITHFSTKEFYSGETGISEAPQNTTGGNATFGSTVINGVTDFYIQRLNDEIDAAFLSQMNSVLKKYPEIGILFPETRNTLSKIELTRYKAALNALATAFRHDMNALPGNFPRLASISNRDKNNDILKYCKLIDRHNSLTALFAALDIFSMVNEHVTPAEILQRVDTASYIARTAPNSFRAVIQMAALTSYSLRDIRIGDDAKTARGWVSDQQINLLRNNLGLFRIFMGLYTQNAGNITFTQGKDTVRFADLLNDNFCKVLKAKYLIYNFRQFAEDFNTLVKNAAAVDNDREKKLAFALSITSRIMKLSQVAADILPSSSSGKIASAVDEYQTSALPYISQVGAIAASISAKQYSQTIYHVDTLLINIITTAKDDQASKNTDSVKVIQNYFNRYGLFIASVAEAQKPEDVKSALNAFALPVGSSRIKKQTSFSFGINSYVGIYEAWNSQYAGITIPKREFGITLPIGFEINKGHFLGGSISAFAGVLDIGAIFAYKAATDSTVTSSIQLQQILSPSLGLIYGLPVIKEFNIPLSFGANFQWGPKLRSLTATGNSVLPLMIRRFNLFLAIDIPVVNFYTSKN